MAAIYPPEKWESPLLAATRSGHAISSVGKSQRLYQLQVIPLAICNVRRGRPR